MQQNFRCFSFVAKAVICTSIYGNRNLNSHCLLQGTGGGKIFGVLVGQPRFYTILALSLYTDVDHILICL